MATKKRVLTEDDIKRAIRNSSSNRGAARYLGVSFPIWKSWASKYTTDTGETYYKKHCNPSGAGTKKISSKSISVADILDGKLLPWNYSAKLVKRLLIKDNYLVEQCNRCGYNKRRNLDMKVPLILFFRDLNKKNYNLNNLEFLCYNCHFHAVGDVYDEKQLKAMEDYDVIRAKKIHLDLPDKYETDFNNRMMFGETVKEELVLPAIEAAKEKIDIVEKIDDIDLEIPEDDFGSDLISYIK